MCNYTIMCNYIIICDKNCYYDPYIHQAYHPAQSLHWQMSLIDGEGSE